MAGLTLRGVNGSIRWGYHTAAVLGNWTVAPQTGGSFTLSAAIVTGNTYQLGQHPLVFVMAGARPWPIEDLTITGTTLRATLGPLGGGDTNTKGAHEHQNAAAGDHKTGDQSG